MILVSGATATLKKWDDPRFGVLVVPGAGNNPDALPLRPGKWAMDNGAYTGLDKPAFLNMLERYHPYQALDADDVVTVIEWSHGRRKDASA